MASGKLAVALLLAVIAVLFLLYGAFLIFREFDDNKDIAQFGYLAIGGISALVGVLFGWAAILTVGGPSGRRVWLSLALVALVTGLVPYAGIVGAPGYAVNGLLGLLALGAAARFAIGVPARPGPPRPPS